MDHPLSYIRLADDVCYMYGHDTAKARHTDVVLQIFTALSRVLNGSEFIARSEAGSALNRTDPASIPQPDVLVVEKAKWDRAVQLNDWLEGAPLIAIEVISPGNRPVQMRKKVDLYLNGGSSAVWCVYDLKRKVVVHDAEEETEFRMGETIPVLNGLSVAVDEIFQ